MGMIEISLLIDEEYIEEFMKDLPRDKIRVVENDFKENKLLLEKELNSYNISSEEYTPYNVSMKTMNDWLEAKK